jgi:hypothetical protein
VIGIGARASLDLVGSDADAGYGTRTPFGFIVYVELHARRDKMTMPMHMKM